MPNDTEDAFVFSQAGQSLALCGFAAALIRTGVISPDNLITQLDRFSNEVMAVDPRPEMQMSLTSVISYVRQHWPAAPGTSRAGH